jgi:hypothetical protein
MKRAMARKRGMAMVTTWAMATATRVVATMGAIARTRGLVTATTRAMATETTGAMVRATRVAGNKEGDGEGGKGVGNGDEEGNCDSNNTGNGNGNEGEQIMVTNAALNTCARY